MLVIIKGAGDLASGIALRLFHAGFDIVMTEIASPLSVRRTVSFSRAVYEGSALVEDVTAVLAAHGEDVKKILSKSGDGTSSSGSCPCGLRLDTQRKILVIVDPEADVIKSLKPCAVVDAIMAKKNTGTKIGDAPIVIGTGPGFIAGIDCHAVIETQRGHSLGRVITEGSAIPNTGVPGSIGGFTSERLLRVPADGIFKAFFSIGDYVKKGDTVAMVKSVLKSGADIPIKAEINGILRGILPEGIEVKSGMKAGDIDPRCDKQHCYTVSDKALAIGGGVLEAILRFHNSF
ncbi:MAG: selenium-dependent molybdenum cofactor biosynthesis protein YqeB [Treponema sp.]|nr:selenium-dependent molybdenum cofactor biosynthesis protein YqeB [Treponema sp.]